MSRPRLWSSTARRSPRSLHVGSVNGQPVVQLEEGFDRAWRRTGLALDRTGFTVEDRNRKQGIYFVRYQNLTSENSEPGFFSKMFSGSKKANEATKYRIAVRSVGRNPPSAYWMPMAMQRALQQLNASSK